MNSRRFLAAWVIGSFVMLFLVACGSTEMEDTLSLDSSLETQVTPTEPIPLPTVTAPQATTTTSPATATVPQATATIPQATLEPLSVRFPLSEPGPYDVGEKAFDFEDKDRDARHVGVAIWYPALPHEDYIEDIPVDDAQPDAGGAPYPLLLSSSKMAGSFATHLASHGFVVAGIRGQDASERWGMWLIDYPRDILFALEQIASTPLDGLEGIIDADHAGTLGYSFDGYNSLAVSGARVDPEFYLAKCADARPTQPAPALWWITYICEMSGQWDEFVAHAGEDITSSADGLWQPMTDERIRAVIPMGPEGAWLFGERGLAAVDRPVLIIGATRDKLNYYDLEAVYILEHLDTADRAMISFIDEGHMMIYDADSKERMQHFATAFFGYHLQGRGEWADYFSEQFVNQHDDLAWGVYTDE